MPLKNTKCKLNAVEVKSLSFYYAGSSRPSLQNVNFELKEGSILLLVGTSGCGKTTLLRAIVGLIPKFYEGKYEGTVYLNGKNLNKMDMPEISQTVGYLFQNPDNQLFSHTVERDIAFGLENLGIEKEEAVKRIEDVIKMLSIEHIRNKPIYELSDGQKQIVALAGILVLRPKLLVLDEPTSLLDPKTAMNIMNIVKLLRDKYGISTIIVEHRLELALEISDYIMVMDNGSVKLFDTTQNALKNDLYCYGVSVPPVIQLQKALGYGSFDLTVKDLIRKLSAK
jgi:energy-coupling factor transporter ATP-binding protein EcfA2